jgi:glutathione reductase (NADPH)
MTKHYDYFVIGAGSGGTRSARIAGAHGAKVGIAEKSKLGGTCVNLGCVPKKIMTNAASYSQHFKDSKGFGWTYESPSFDWTTLITRKNDRISAINAGFQEMLESAGVEIHHAAARFIDAHTLDVGGDIITATNILIATGGKPRPLDVQGHEHSITSDQFFHLPAQPKKAVIVGGGYIALEFAGILNELGTSVTVLYYKDLFLSNFDHDISSMLAEQMRKKGIEICFNSSVKNIAVSGAEKIVHTSDGKTHYCDTVISAIGRTANLGSLNIEAAGVLTDARGFIKVDTHYQTSVPHIFAVGDVTDTYHLTPVAIAEGHTLADRLFGSHDRRTVHYNNIPSVIFSNPPIGTIGLSETQARSEGFDVRIFKTTFTPAGFRMSDRDEQMMMKLVVDKATDRVIGCHVIGIFADEMIQGFAVAMNAGATKADFDRTIAVHPTASEELVLMRKAFSE